MSTEVNNRVLLTLRTPERGFLWLGAILASSIPIAIGVAIFLPYLDFLMSGCFQSSSSGSCKQYQYHGDEFALIIFPISATFIFLTPIVCWICCRYVLRLIRENSLKLFSLYSFTAVTALKGHIAAGLIQLIWIISDDVFWKFSSLDEVGIIFIWVFCVLIIHSILAVLVTVPLSLICASIFRIVSLKKVK